MSEVPIFNWKSTVSANGLIITEVDFPELQQEYPFNASSLFKLFCEDFNNILETCKDKRFNVTGVVSKIGLDIHGKPSIELSDCVGGQCYTLFVFATEDDYKDVAIGNVIECRGNYLGVTNEFGVVMKRSQIL